jgi:NADPH:quinone reductase-like Zn-dependent oxidoreductase
VVRAEEATMFDGMASRDKDPRKSLHVQEVATPELGPGEALVAVMASAINYNTVWTSIFEPVSTFSFLQRYGRISELAKRHDLPYHIVGSDLAGVVMRVGAGVTKWKPGMEVVAHCLSVELEDAAGHDDTMLDPQQRIWGFETNFGGLAQMALVKANQLMPKPRHLTWEEAACPGLVNSTAYRQLISAHGAQMKQGDTVLIWGASGGLGSYATQFALNGGAVPVCVVSSPQKAELCHAMGAELVIDRAAEGYRFWPDEQSAGSSRVAPAWGEDPGPDRRRRPGHRLRTPGPGDVRRVRVRGQARRHRGYVRVDVRVHASVRQPLSVDERQANHRLTLRQLPRGVGGEPAHRPRPDPPDAVKDVRDGSRGAGRVRGAPQRASGQGRRALSGPRRRPRCARRREAGQAPDRDQYFPR